MDGTDGLENNREPTLENDDDFKIKGAAIHAKSHAAQKEAKSEDCIICLQPITERAVATPCNHLAFDFICLVSWIQTRETCPLCNANIAEIQYDWRDLDDYKTFRLRHPGTGKADQDRGSWPLSRRGDEDSSQNRTHHVRSNQRVEASVQRQQHEEDPSLARRRRVYQDGLYSLHVGANSISRYRDFTPQGFASSASLQSRARMFLRRELQVFTYFDYGGRMRNREFVLEYIVAVLKKFDPKGADGRAEDFLSEFLTKENASLLLHELCAWLRSPYATLGAWDRNVQYRGHELESRWKGNPTG